MTEDEDSKRYYYSALVGIRDNGLPYVGSFVTKSNQIVSAVKEKIFFCSNRAVTGSSPVGGVSLLCY